MPLLPNRLQSTWFARFWRNRKYRKFIRDGDSHEHRLGSCKDFRRGSCGTSYRLCRRVRILRGHFYAACLDGEYWIMQVNVMKRLGEWLENPCGATHSRLVREMAACNEALDDMRSEERRVGE